MTKRGVSDLGNDKSDLRDFTRILREEMTIDITK